MNGSLPPINHISYPIISMDMPSIRGQSRDSAARDPASDAAGLFLSLHCINIQQCVDNALIAIECVVELWN